MHRTWLEIAERTDLYQLVLDSLYPQIHKISRSCLLTPLDISGGWVTNCDSFDAWTSHEHTSDTWMSHELICNKCISHELIYEREVKSRSHTNSYVTKNCVPSGEAIHLWTHIWQMHQPRTYIWAKCYELEKSRIYTWRRIVFRAEKRFISEPISGKCISHELIHGRSVTNSRSHELIREREVCSMQKSDSSLTELGFPECPAHIEREWVRESCTERDSHSCLTPSYIFRTELGFPECPAHIEREWVRDIFIERGSHSYVTSLSRRKGEWVALVYVWSSWGTHTWSSWLIYVWSWCHNPRMSESRTHSPSCVN